MGKRLLLTYFYISLVDLFIYFYLPSPTTSQAGTTAQGGLEVSASPWPHGRVTHAVESLVLITPRRQRPSLPPSGEAAATPGGFGKMAFHPSPVQPS